ncbi:uncharacterized protein BX664DRAFT_333589 [Halteromyces radiatus]|uniref:uncharacterized protein n=1 Tax=Halteromyces radiatus TaxID=101107 RepID=UPI00221F4F37|nr:uncharacterized protein BX664DRAFT_333589 [Halteromyces radiatus]KAI8089666.1 hypothetical protein BX664DRAFT_333589 [Halteromyces radiatus]
MPDLFPLFDPELDISYLDIFQPLPLRPYQRANVDRSSKISYTHDTTTTKPTSTHTTTTTSKFTTGNNNFYCKECKKKFNNDATMQNHLKSAKHLATVKKASGGKKLATTTKQSSGSDQNEFIDPATTESLRKMDSIGNLSPQQAVPSYFEVSREFYKQRRPLYTANALSALISLNQDIDIHWDAQLVLARLYCIYNGQMELAYDNYLNVLEGKWGIKKNDLLLLAKQCGKKDAMEFKEICHQAAKSISQSLYLLSLLEECAGAFAQKGTIVTGYDNIAEKLAIVFYEFAFTISPDKERSYLFCPMISQIYDAIGLTLCSMDTQLFYGTHMAMTGLKYESMVLLFSLFLKAIEIDDYLRMDKIYQHILSLNGIIYPDVKLLSKISVARCNLDQASLDNDLKSDIDHIELLLLTNTADSHLLLLDSLEHGLQLDYLNRLRRCLLLD